MPSFNSLKDDEIWRLVHFVEALAAPEGVEPAILGDAVAVPSSATQPTARVIDQAMIPSLEAR